MTPDFIDLSHWNTIPEDLRAAFQAGILGVIHKATEGTGWRDEKLEARHSLVCEVPGMLWGVYHFIRPDEVVVQVDHFLETVGPYSDRHTLYALDWEDGEVGLDAAIEFLRRVKDDTGHDPVLYSGNTVKEALAGQPNAALSCYRLWLAQYGPEAELPPGWDHYWAWQYTDQGTVPGIDPPVDLNYYGGAGWLRDDWTGR